MVPLALPPAAPVVEDPGPLLSTPAEKKAALAAATVSSGDLTLGKLTIAGPCWKTKRHAAIIHGFAGTKGNLGFPIDDAGLGIDLDGDGTPDDLLFMGATNITSTYEVYLRRGAYGYHLGRIETDTNLEVTKTKTNGLFDLEGERACRVLCCASSEKSRYSFNGKKYVKTKTWKVTNDCSKSPF